MLKEASWGSSGIWSRYLLSTSLWRVSRHAQQEEIPGYSHNPLERMFISSGLKMPQDPPGGTGCIALPRTSRTLYLVCCHCDLACDIMVGCQKLKFPPSSMNLLNVIWSYLFWKNFVFKNWFQSFFFLECPFIRTKGHFKKSYADTEIAQKWSL